MINRGFLFAGLTMIVMLMFSAPGFGKETKDVKKSTAAIGSPFFRHLANDFDIDLRKLYRFERKGFGRAEVVTLVLLSKITGTEIKEYGKRRVKKSVTLKELSEEAGLEYITLYKVVQEIKNGIEKKGDKNLPDPIFDWRIKKEIDEDKKKKRKPPKSKKEDELP